MHVPCLFIMSPSPESCGPRQKRHIGQAAVLRVTSLTENTSHYVGMRNVVISAATSGAFYTLGLQAPLKRGGKSRQ